jgi:hypothetical protein
MAEQILAEIGTNIKKQFPSAAHMCSWAALVPGHNESAGKRKSSKGKKGNKYLKSALTEAAHSVGASKNYLGAMYRRTLARKGRSNYCSGTCYVENRLLSSDKKRDVCRLRRRFLPFQKSPELRITNVLGAAPFLKMNEPRLL